MPYCSLASDSNAVLILCLMFGWFVVSEILGREQILMARFRFPPGRSLAFRFTPGFSLGGLGSLRHLLRLADVEDGADTEERPALIFGILVLLFRPARKPDGDSLLPFHHLSAVLLPLTEATDDGCRWTLNQHECCVYVRKRVSFDGLDYS